MVDKAERKALFDKLVAEGADPAEASKFSGFNPKGNGNDTKTKTKKTNGNGKTDTSPSPKSSSSNGKTKTVSSPNLPRMNTTSAQKIIFGIMIGVTALTIFGDVISGKSRMFDVVPRRMIGGSLAGIMLMLMAVPAPRLAVAFAAVAGAGALFIGEGGQAIVNGLTRLTGGTVPNSGPDLPKITPGQPS